jgi:hypothetical protein
MLENAEDMFEDGIYELEHTAYKYSLEDLF